MNKRDVKDIDDVIQYYDQVRLVRFKEDVVIAHIQDVFKNTINEDKERNIPSYYTKGGIHCRSAKYRSLDDIIKLSKYYFPGILVSEIVKELLIYSEDHIGKTVIYRYCPDVRKSNFVVVNFHYGHSFSHLLSDGKYKYNNVLLLSKLGFPNCTGSLFEILD